MKIASAQINTTVGDISGNIEKIKAFYRKAEAQQVDLVVFPELAICGYPPAGLLDRSDFVRENLSALKSLTRMVGKTGMIVGYAEVNGKKTGKPLHNAAALIQNKKIAAKRFKTLLPSYPGFDETRYFEPAQGNLPIKFGSTRLGLSICEDAFDDESFWRRPRAEVDIVRRQAAAGVRFLLNIAACPYERDKVALRHKMMRRHAVSAKRPVITCALVGSNNGLIFDGNSFALDARGKLVLQAKSFEEDLLVVSPDAEVPDAQWTEMDPIEELYRALVLGIRDYVHKSGFEDVILGLSGGIDSALTCVLAVDALGAQHVTGVSMPSMHSSDGSVADAEAITSSLGLRLYQIPINPIYDTVLAALLEAFRDTPSGIAEQNIQARIRGLLLMGLSNKAGGMLLATGNRSEAAVGYCTLYGDTCGGLAPIGDVPKTTVYELARWINREEERIPKSSIDKAPSAELAPDQKDQDDLPPYGVLDAILAAHIDEGKEPAAIARSTNRKNAVAQVMDRMKRTEFKRRQAPPVLHTSPLH
ncbi:NAD+ synthase [Elusimicrobiota bacterium]